MKTKVIELAPGVILDMVHIPAGKFTMGSPQDEFNNEGPLHEVTLEAFYMSKCPITQAQWQAVASIPAINWELNPNPSYFSNSCQSDRHPVENISWYDAMEFCDRLSVYTGQTYTLPSEAQWEYGCRADTTTPYYFGEEITPNLVNYHNLSTFPVATFPSNNFGLYDMHGNVWEWCLDHWHDSYEGAPTNGAAWVSKGDCRFCILRGGSWNSASRDCRSAYRDYFNPNCSLSYIGFRVVSVPPKTLG